MVLDTPLIEFNNLSQENIELAETAICSDRLQPIENNDRLSISYRDYESAILGYQEMIKDTTPNTSYFLFGGNAYGMQSYGFYKARNSNVYIIDSYMGYINRVFIPDKNIDCFKNIID